MPEPVVHTFPATFIEYQARCDRIGTSPLAESEFSAISRQYNELKNNFSNRDDATSDILKLTLKTLMLLGLLRESAPVDTAAQNSQGKILSLSDLIAARLTSQTEPESSAQSRPPIDDELNRAAATIFPRGHTLVAFGRLADGQNFLIHDSPIYDSQPDDIFKVELWNAHGSATYSARYERSPEELRFYIEPGVFIIPHNSDTGRFDSKSEGGSILIIDLRRQFAVGSQS
jgi:hypothetical protein